MHIVFRNFFYAIGLHVVLWLFWIDPETASLRDVVFIAHLSSVHTSVLTMTVLFCGLEWFWNHFFSKQGSFIPGSVSAQLHTAKAQPAQQLIKASSSSKA